MKTYIQLLILLIIVLAAGTRGFAQGYTNSGPNAACGSASGTLTANNITLSEIAGWEEGYYDNGQFQMQVPHPPPSPADQFSYSITATTANITKVYRVKRTGSPATYPNGDIAITVYKPTSVGTLSGNAVFMNSASGTINLSSYSHTPHFGSNHGLLTHVSGGTYSYSGLTQTTTFQAGITNGLCSSTSNSVTIKVYKKGSITVQPTSYVGERVSVAVTGYTADGIIGWEYSTDNGASWIFVNHPSAGYRFEVTSNTKFRALFDFGTFGQQYSDIATTTVVPYSAAFPLPVNGANYVKENRVAISGKKSVSEVANLPVGAKQEVTNYLDGLGKSIQTNIRKATNDKKDLIAFSDYDRLGRTPNQYLPYVSATNDGVYRSNTIGEQSSFFSSSADNKIAKHGCAFGSTTFEESPMGKATSSSQPGNCGVSSSFAFSTNAVNEVRKFNSDGSSSVFYAQNDLVKVEFTDEDGKKRQSFTDKSGKTILSRVQLDETIDGASFPWLETYNIYYENGALRYIISPKGVAVLKDGSWVLTSAILEQYTHQFVYDTRGRLIEKKVPGQEWLFYCYDQLDRVVLVQDGYLRPTQKWLYFKYDRKGRVVQQGIWTYPGSPSGSSRANIQDNVLSPFYSSGTIPYFEDHASTNFTFPTSNVEVLGSNYYDGYGPSSGYTTQGLPGEGTEGSKLGLLSFSSRKIIGATTLLQNYYMYDKDGRVIQIKSNNHLSSATDNLKTIVYDFEGKIKFTKTYHNAGSGNTTTVLNRYIYDHMGRLKQIYQKNNSDAEVLVVHYNYNGLGQLVEKNLHCPTCLPVGSENGVLLPEVLEKDEYLTSESILKATSMIRLLPGYTASAAAGNTLHATIAPSIDVAESTYTPSMFLQSIDYRYTINGQVASINNSKLTAEALVNDDANDYFGMEFLYNSTESGLGNTAYYNGSLSAIKWKGFGTDAGTADQRSYKFTYDKASRLKTAVSQMHTGSAWSKETNALNESMTYDHNGNIKTLQRNRRKYGINSSTLAVTYSSEQIDDLTYTYSNATGDQLLKIVDAVSGNTGAAGFNNGASGTGDDYAYDVNGGIVSDVNKGIDTVYYNILGKPSQVDFTDGRKIEFTYDAAGTKLTMKNFAAGSPATPYLTTQYVDGFVYENNTLKFFGSPEGRVVKNGSALEYQYAIADHQGNTRVVFSSVTPAPVTKTATFETSARGDEDGWFENYPSGANINPVSTNNHTPGGTHSQYLHGGHNSMVGVAKSFSVYPGDEVKIDAYARYTPSSGPGSLANFTSALLGAFQLSPPAPGEFGTASSGLNFWGTKEAGGFANGSNNNTDPKAFVTIIIFDRDYNFLDVAYQQVTSSGSPALISASYTVKEAGFAFLYVSNENPTLADVYFDDVTITHTPTNIIQYNDYYPFGLQASTSWTRENNTNNFLYNEGSELNATTGWYETFFRDYDPAIGRFLSVDPMATKYASWSGYHYSGNNPVMINDPTGADYTSWDDEYRARNYQAGCNCYEGQQGGGYGVTNPGFSPEVWELVKSVIDNTPDGGTGKWNPITGGTYYDRYGEEVSRGEYYPVQQWYRKSYNKGTSQERKGSWQKRTLWKYREAAKQGNPLGENALNSRFTQRGNEVGVANLTFEFFTGTGPEYSMFVDGHPMTERLKQSYIVSLAKIKFALGGNKPLRMWDAPFGVGGAGLSGKNPTEQFIGGARITIIPTAAGNLFIVNNTTDKHSFEAHQGRSIPRDSNILTPEGSIYQRFIWLEK